MKPEVMRRERRNKNIEDIWIIHGWLIYWLILSWKKEEINIDSWNKYCIWETKQTPVHQDKCMESRSRNLMHIQKCFIIQNTIIKKALLH